MEVVYLRSGYSEKTQEFQERINQEIRKIEKVDFINPHGKTLFPTVIDIKLSLAEDHACVLILWEMR